MSTDALSFLVSLSTTLFDESIQSEDEENKISEKEAEVRRVQIDKKFF